MSADLFCSFCGKKKHEVEKFFAGPDAFICIECVELFHEMAQDPPPAPPENDG